MAKLFSNKGLNNMTSEDYITNNKLIARFVEYPTPLTCYHLSDDFKLLYNESWDWLIPVCQKWDTLFLDVSPLEYDEDKYIELCDDLDNTMTLYDIKGVYKQLVININWYNNIKNG